jgi:hypothetical protein
MLQILAEYSAHSGKARALILNTATSMERPALAHIALRACATSSP